MESLSFKKFKKNIKQETYENCRQIMIKNNYSDSEADHEAHMYADSIMKTDGSMVTDMYKKYTDGVYTLEEATRGALNIVTHLFCLKHGFDPANKDYILIFLDETPSPRYLYVDLKGFNSLDKVKEMWKRYFQ